MMCIEVGRFEGEASKDWSDRIGLPIGQINLLSHHWFVFVSYTMTEASRRGDGVGEVG